MECRDEADVGAQHALLSHTGYVREPGKIHLLRFRHTGQSRCCHGALRRRERHDPGDVLRWPGKWDRRAELRTLVGTARRTDSRTCPSAWSVVARRNPGLVAAMEKRVGDPVRAPSNLPSGEAATRRIRQHQRPVGSVLHRLRARTAASVLRSEAAERCVAQSGSMPTSGRDHRHRLQRSGPDSRHSRRTLVVREVTTQSQRTHIPARKRIFYGADEIDALH